MWFQALSLIFGTEIAEASLGDPSLLHRGGLLPSSDAALGSNAQASLGLRVLERQELCRRTSAKRPLELGTTFGHHSEDPGDRPKATEDLQTTGVLAGSHGN